MPALEVIVRVVEYDQALNDRAAEVEDGCEIGLPCADDLPACGKLAGMRERDNLTDL